MSDEFIKILGIRSNMLENFVDDESIVDCFLTGIFGDGPILIHYPDYSIKNLRTIAKIFSMEMKQIDCSLNVERGFDDADLKEPRIFIMKNISTPNPASFSSLESVISKKVFTHKDEKHSINPASIIIALVAKPILPWSDYPSWYRILIDKFLLYIKVKDNIKDYKEEIDPCITPDELLSLKQKILNEVIIPDEVLEHAIKIVNETRKTPSDSLIVTGASPRASMSFTKASKALAAIRGHREVLIEDINQLAEPILFHRISFHTNPVYIMEKILKPIFTEKT